MNTHYLWLICLFTFACLGSGCKEHVPAYPPRNPHEVQKSLAADHFYFKPNVIVMENIDSCKVYISEDGKEAFLETVYIFDRQGNPDKRISYIRPNDDTNIYYLYEHNSDRQLTKVSSHGSEGELQFQKILKYDNDGLLVREKFTWSGDNPSHIIHNYEDSLLISTTYASESSKSHNRSYGYDNRGNLTSVITGKVGEGGEAVAFEYNKDNQLIKYMGNKGPAARGSFLNYEYEYENNQMVAHKIYDKDGLSMLQTSVFDSRGLPSSEMVYFKIEHADTANASKRKYRYEYTSRFR